MNSYLGVDLGSKSLGLSISRSGIIASTYKTFYFEEDNYEEALKIILKIINEEKIKIVVIGLPKHMNNDIGIRGEISKKFKEMIENAAKVKTYLWDERTSTKAAIKTLISANVKRKIQKSKKDEVAAVIILQNFLDYKENNKNG